MHFAFCKNAVTCSQQRNIFLKKIEKKFLIEGILVFLSILNLSLLKLTKMQGDRIEHLPPTII